MSNDSTCSTMLHRFEHLFNGQTFSSSTSNEMNFTDEIVNDLDQFLTPNNENLSDSNLNCSPSNSQFEFILNALTTSSARINEETTTYLNQGQPYEIKFRSYRNHFPTVFRSVLRLCFWEKNLQIQERELIQKWFNEYQSPTLFDIDMNSTYGVLSIIRSKQISNAVEIVWDTSNNTTPTTLSIRFNCTSTDFALKRHGGEKGIPLRLQIDTYHQNDPDEIQHVYSCFCKIQLFRLKGAQRKFKADQMRIDKLDLDQRRRYQITSEFTSLKPCGISPLYTLNLLSLSHPPDDLSDIYSSTSTNETVRHKRNLCSSLPNLKYDCSTLVTKLTPQSSSDDVVRWLNQQNFSSIVPRFQHYRGVDLFRLSFDEIHRICHGDDSLSIRLFNELNEKVIPPRKVLYIQLEHQHTFAAIYLHSLTRKEFEEKFFEFLQPIDEKIFHFFLELERIRIRIDNDNVVKYSIPNESRFTLRKVDNEIFLSLINDDSSL